MNKNRQLFYITIFAEHKSIKKIQAKDFESKRQKYEYKQLLINAINR